MKRYKIIILSFIIHIIIILCMRYDVLPEIHHFKWCFKHGGDQFHYFKLANSLSKGKLIENQFTLGFPIFLAPFIKFTNNVKNYKDILNSVLLVYNLILYPIFLIMLFNIFEKISKNNKIAKLSVIIYSLFPLLLYLSVGSVRSFFLGGIYMGREIWLVMLSEPLSVFLCFTLIYFMTFKEKIQKYHHYFFIGILFGYTVMVKLNYILICVIFIPWILDKKWKGIFIAAFGAFLAFTPQLYYNYTFFKSPFKTGYQKAWKNDLPKYQADIAKRNGIVSYKNAIFLHNKIKSKFRSIDIFLWLFLFLWIIAIVNCNREQIPLQLYTLIITIFYLCYFGTFLSLTRYFSILFPSFIFSVVLSFSKIFSWIKK